MKTKIKHELLKKRLHYGLRKTLKLSGLMLTFFILFFSILHQDVKGQCNRTTCTYMTGQDIGTTGFYSSWYTKTGTLPNGTTLHRYDVYLYAGTTYEFSMCDGGGTANFDAYLCLTSGTNGCGLSTDITNDDYCSNKPKIIWTPSSSGWRSLYVSGYGNNYGNYTFAYRYTFIPMPPPTLNTSATPNSITVSWNAVNTATQYYVQIQTSSDFQGWGVGSIQNNSTTGTSYTFYGLSPNTVYYIFVTSTNSSSGWQWYQPTRVNTSTLCSPSGVPGSLSPSPSGATTANLSWSSVTGSPTITYYWEVRTTGGTTVASGNTTGTTATATGLSPNTTYNFRVRSYTSCNGTYSSWSSNSSNFTTYPANPTSISVSPSSSVCQGTQVTLTANGAQGTVYWFTTGCTTSGHFAIGNSVNVTPSSTTTYYARNNNGNWSSGCASTTVTVNTLPGLATAVNGFRCGTGTVNLSVTNIPSGCTIDWYAAATGGTALLSGNANFTTPSISTTTTYYAETRNTTTSCVSSSRVPVTATVNTIPGLATAVNGERCGTGTVNLSVTNIPSGCTIDWYAAATGGTALLSGNANFTTPSISTTTTYYAETRNTTTGCISSSRVPVTATVKEIPSAPVAGNNGPVCEGSTLILTASGVTGAIYSWTSPDNYGSIMETWQRPNATLAMGGTYYVNATLNGCTGPSGSTNVVVNPKYNITLSQTIYDYQIPYAWEGLSIWGPGIYTKSLTSSSGCDSIRNLNLSVSGSGTIWVNKNMGTAVQANWTPVAGATSYRLRYGQNGVWTMHTTSQPRFRIVNLTPMTTYDLQVQYFDGTNWSDWSYFAPIQFTTENIEFQFTRDIGTRAIIEWTDLPHTSSYILQYKPSTTTDWINTGEYTTNSTVINYPLEDNTDYDFRVIPRYQGISMWWSAPQTITTMNVQYWFTRDIGTRAILNFSEIPGAIKYVLLWKENTSNIWKLATVPTASTSTTLNNLTSATQYNFKLNVYFDNTIWGSTASKTLTTNKINISVSSYNGTQATFTWDVVTNPNASAYFLQYRVIGQSNWQSKYTTTTTTTVTGLDPQQNYEYRLTVRYGNPEVSWGATEVYPLIGAKETEVEQQITMHVYPNPVSEVLTVEVNTFENATQVWKLYDVNGKIVMSGEQSLSAGKNIYELDVNRLPAGMYMLQSEINGQVVNTRIIRQ